jgi:hypothetical protein
VLPKIKRHKGYRVLAIDGSELRLDKTKENKDIFLSQGTASENKTNARISLLYDVISHYVIDAQIGSIGVSEREYAMKNLARFSSVCDEKDIVIFDRGYPSRNMIAALSDMGCKYLMRLQASCFKGVKENPSNDFRIRTCSHRICTWIFEHNFDEGKGAGVQWTPLQSRSTDRDDS